MDREPSARVLVQTTPVKVGRGPLRVHSSWTVRKCSGPRADVEELFVQPVAVVVVGV